MKTFIKNVLAVLVIAGVSFMILLAFDLVPEEITGLFALSNRNIGDSVSSSVSYGQTEPVSDIWPVPFSDDQPIANPGGIISGPEPDRLIIPKIVVDSPVSNPQTRDVAVLDAALLKGVVSYPGAGSLDGSGNVFLFGHSSNWPVVRNQAFKSLNGLDKLVIGDEIKVRAGHREYLYKVFAVTLADSTQSLVTVSRGRRMVTISTCDTFGKKSDRIVVEAAYERDYEI